DRIESCRPCIQGKMKRKSFPKTSTMPGSSQLEHIHIDLYGPFPMGFLRSKCHFQTFTDDYT
ncbi:hypothetical protein BDK51DRAFT_9397, partial [Blyttiomyces helicus]